MTRGVMTALPMLLWTACGHMGPEARGDRDIDEIVAELVGSNGFSGLQIGEAMPAPPNDWECTRRMLGYDMCSAVSDRRVKVAVDYFEGTALIERVRVLMPNAPRFLHDDACSRFRRLRDLLTLRLGAPGAVHEEVCTRPEPDEPNIGDGACAGWRSGGTQVAVAIGRDMEGLHSFAVELEIEKIDATGHHELMCGDLIAAPSGSQ
ncbi:MAG: hypothetical protein QM723_37305 [Myxococcaceae bacterium]